MSLNYEKTRGIINFIKAGGATNFSIRKKFGYEMSGDYTSFNGDMYVIQNAIRIAGYNLIVERMSGNTYSYSIKKVSEETALDCLVEPKYDKKSLFKMGCKFGLFNSILSEKVHDIGEILFKNDCAYFLWEIGDELKNKKEEQKATFDFDKEVERIWNEEDVQEALI